MRYSKLTFFWVILCFCCSYAFNMYGQQSKDSITALKEIIISKDVFKELIPVQTLQGEELQRLNSYSVADALRFFSGVKIKDYGGLGGLKTIDVRNMGTHHVGVFYNGLAVGNAQNGVVDLGKFSLDNIEAVQLYNGQRSTIFQSAKEYASASTVYIQSKKPVFESGKDLNLSTKYKFGSIQMVNPSVRLEYKVSPFISTSFSSEYVHSNGVYKFRQKRFNSNGTVAYDTIGHRINSDITAYRLENNWFGLHDNNKWQANLYYYQSDRGLPSAIIKKSDITLATENSHERQRDKNVMLQGEWINTSSEFYNLLVKGKFAYDYTQFLSRKTVDFEGEEVTYNPQFDNTFFQQNWYLSATNLFYITPAWQASFSADIDYEKLNATRLGQDTPFSFPTRYTYYLSVATSLDLGKVKAEANILGTFTDEKVKYNYQAPNRSVFTPSIFVSYQPFQNEQLIVHAFYKHIFRLPTFNDLYYTQIGTANLKPEYAKQFNIGINYQTHFSSNYLRYLNFAIEGYYANITDKIIASPTSSMMRWMMTNLGKVESKGIETRVNSTFDIAKEISVDVNLNYEYTIAKDLSVTPFGKTSYYGDQIPYAPWHSGSVTASVNYNNWTLNYSFIYVGKRYNGNKNNIKKNELQPWYTHDIALQRSFVWKDYRFKTSVELNNLANQYYEVVTNFPMPGRNIRLILSFDL